MILEGLIYTAVSYERLFAALIRSLYNGSPLPFRGAAESHSKSRHIIMGNSVTVTVGSVHLICKF